MKHRIIKGIGGAVGLVLREFRVHEVPNDIRKIFSDYVDAKEKDAKEHRWTYQPKEFINFSFQSQELLINLVSKVYTSKRNKTTWLCEVLVGNKKKYFTKKETE